MPKTFSTYGRFDGGLNSESDPRDIADNEISAASNVMVDAVGRIRAIGALGSTPVTEGSSDGIAGVSAKAQAGYGLFVFGGDYDMSGTPEQADCKFIAVAHTPSSGDQTVKIFGDHDASGTDTSWVTEATLGTTGSARMVFYYTNGALRICDANFGEENPMKWLGYIKTAHFDGTPSDALSFWTTWAYYGPVAATADNYATWCESTCEPTAPTAGIVSAGISAIADSGSSTYLYDATLETYDDLNTNTYKALAYYSANQVKSITGQTTTGSITTDALSGTTWEGQRYVIFPPTSNGVTICPMTTGSTGTWTNSVFEFAITGIYSDDSESCLNKIDGTFTPTSSQGVFCFVYLTGTYSQRLKGMRVYYRKENTNDAWKLFSDIDLSRGARGSMSGVYNGWVAMQEGDDYKVSLFYSTDPQTTTFESLTGFPQDTTSLSVKAKCFATGNGRAWAANVRVVNDAGDPIVYGDRLMYTPPGKYDTWPPEYYMDLVPADGDQFTALHVYADRLLAFKKNVLYIINISHGSSMNWYRETQHDFMGVKLQGATCKTEFGVIWANENSCFIYDGEKITDLISPKGIRRISKSDWETFITNYSLVGFYPKKNQIIVLGDASGVTGSIYLCDLATGGWTKGSKFSKSTGYYTNFEVFNNDLIIGDYTT